MRGNVHRREFLNWSAGGLAPTSSLALLMRDGVVAAPGPVAKAKRAVQISLVGGMSHIDSFDHKPELTKRHGQPLGSDSKPDVFFGQVGLLRKPGWEFKQRGKSGLWVSELFPHIAGVAD